MLDVNSQDRFVLCQRVKLVINQYVFSVPEAESDGDEFMFVEQKRFKFKEDIRFFEDDTKSAEVMKLLARERFDPRARYDITTPDGTKVGQIQKVFGKSLLRSTYTLFDAEGEETCVAREVSVPKAILRRAVGFIPYVNDFADFLPIAYDFEYVRGDEVLGINRRRRWKWRDIYEIDLTADAGRTLDRRLILASAVGMDALQAR